MGSGLAKTYDPKASKGKMGMQANNSAASLGTNYVVPSTDGRLINATPVKLAIKSKPPTIAVVYTMKDHKSGRMKKYIHEIKIQFSSRSDLSNMCDDMISQEPTYLNPLYIGKQQVSRVYLIDLFRLWTCSRSCT